MLSVIYMLRVYITLSRNTNVTNIFSHFLQVTLFLQHDINNVYILEQVFICVGHVVFVNLIFELPFYLSFCMWVVLDIKLMSSYSKSSTIFYRHL